MFEHGLVEEVRDILSLGFAPACKPFESHGYKQSLQLIHGELSRARRGVLCAAQYAALCQAADHVVPAGAGLGVAEGLR